MEISNNIGVNQLNLKPTGDQRNPVAEVNETFGDLLQSTVKQVADQGRAGEKAISELQAGKAQNLHEVMIAVEKADLSLRMLVQMRNKALEAYNEILKMNI